jgi:hypothetical protein
MEKEFLLNYILEEILQLNSVVDSTRLHHLTIARLEKKMCKLAESYEWLKGETR